MTVVADTSVILNLCFIGQHFLSIRRDATGEEGLVELETADPGEISAGLARKMACRISAAGEVEQNL